jgi:hypothetical protein
VAHLWKNLLDEVRRNHRLGYSVNKAVTSTLCVFSARVKEAFMYSFHPLRSDDSHAVEAFAEIAQDGPLPL